MTCLSWGVPLLEFIESFRARTPEEEEKENFMAWILPDVLLPDVPAWHH